MEQPKQTVDQVIANAINARYTIDEQIAIIRQKDTKPDEFEAFFQFAEETKANIKANYKP